MVCIRKFETENESNKLNLINLIVYCPFNFCAILLFSHYYQLLPKQEVTSWIAIIKRYLAEGLSTTVIQNIVPRIDHKMENDPNSLLF